MFLNFFFFHSCPSWGFLDFLFLNASHDIEYHGSTVNVFIYWMNTYASHIKKLRGFCLPRIHFTHWE